MPKFEFSSGFSLAEPLEQLGMRDAFSANHADFSGMTDEVKLKIDAVVHKAFIRVDEEGTEAAAATGIVMPRVASAAPEPIEFKANHPFLFFLRYDDAVLFMGRVADPGAGGS